MNIEQEIINDRSKANIVRIARYIGNDPLKFEEVMELFFRADEMVRHRAGWLMSHCADAHPQLIIPHIGRMVDHMQAGHADGPIKRNALRVISMVKVPEDLMGDLADLCFTYLNDPKEEVAVRVHAMTVLHNITKAFPDLGHELRLAIEAHFPFGSAGFKSRGRRILKALEKAAKNR